MLSGLADPAAHLCRPQTPQNGMCVTPPLMCQPGQVVMNGACATKPAVQIDGSNLATGDGISLPNGAVVQTAVADVRGLYITHFPGAGINLSAATHRSHVIAGNFIGLTPAGLAAPNNTGISDSRLDG